MPNKQSKNNIVCDYCGSSFNNKKIVLNHIQAKHIFHSEDDNKRSLKLRSRTVSKILNKKVSTVKRSKSSKNGAKKYRHVCCACQKEFGTLIKLKYHIREFHFNLLTKTPYSDLKKVNQVWFEKVINSKNIVEMKKVGENILLLRKIHDNTAMKVMDQPTKILDLRDTYRTGRYK